MGYTDGGAAPVRHTLAGDDASRNQIDASRQSQREFEIVHATFNPLVRLPDGFELIERQLDAAGRPVNAVCGIELRIPGALSPAGFEEFNRGYLERITAWAVVI